MSAVGPDPDGWLSQWVTDSLAYLTAECGTPPWRDTETDHATKISSDKKGQAAMTEQQNYYEDTTDRENLEVGRVIPEHPELGPILAIESPDDHPFGKSWEWAIFGCGRAAIVRSLKRG